MEEQHINFIRNKFEKIQNQEDFLNLLNDAKNMLYAKETVPFSLASLKYYANPKYYIDHYTNFTIKKKSGENRIINAPNYNLKSILKVLNFVLQCIYEPHKSAMGFVLNKSIFDNAKEHIKRNYVYNIDLEDFFHSFDRNRVKLGFMQKPFNLSGNREPLAFFMASLCTHPLSINGETKLILPQGSPTSPTITNILCRRLDKRLEGLANHFNLKYTRYADDITFSSNHNPYKKEKFQRILEQIISDEKLSLNYKKIRLQKRGYQQKVTGLVVNQKVNVCNRYIKQLRMWLYYWEKYGYKKAEEIFSRDYIKDKGHIRKGQPHLESVLDGKLLFLKMVKGQDNSTYLKLKKRLNRLQETNSTDIEEGIGFLTFTELIGDDDLF